MPLRHSARVNPSKFVCGLAVLEFVGFTILGCAGPLAQPGPSGQQGDGGAEVVGAQRLEGSFQITNRLDMEQIGRFEEITGNVSIASAGLSQVELTGLRRIGGWLCVDLYGSLGLVGLSAPNLERIGGSLILENSGNNSGCAGRPTPSASLETLSLPSLTSVGGGVRILNLPSLSSFQMPRLQQVGIYEDEAVSIRFQNNRSIPQCLVDRFIEQLPDGGIPGPTITQTNGVGTCP